MAARVRWQGTTTQRGYGAQHQKLREQLLANWRPGDPCTRCGRPMWQRWKISRTGQRIAAIHLGHTDDRTAYRGLEHARCNEADGARRGNRRRGQVLALLASRRTPSRW